MTTIVYPGTFDPFTLGHADLCCRAAKLFDCVIVAVAANPGKNPMFGLEQRVQFITDVMRSESDRVVVKPFGNLLVRFVREQGATAILRGLRAVSDFEYEFQLASMNRHLDAQIETLFLTPSERYAFISSSLVKEVARYDGDVSGYVPENVNHAIKALRG